MNRIKAFFIKLFGRTQKMLNDASSDKEKVLNIEKKENEFDEMRKKHSYYTNLFNSLIRKNKNVEELTEEEKSEMIKILKGKIGETETRVKFLEKKLGIVQ